MFPNMQDLADDSAIGDLYLQAIYFNRERREVRYEEPDAYTRKFTAVVSNTITITSNAKLEIGSNLPWLINPGHHERHNMPQGL